MYRTPLPENKNMVTGFVIYDMENEFTPWIGRQTPAGKIPVFFEHHKEARDWAEKEGIKKYQILYYYN